MASSPAGYVYLIQDGGRHKIGRSSNPGRRLSEVAGPGACIVHVIPSARSSEVEAALHRRFAASALGGEWFRLAAADVELICGVTVANFLSDLPVALLLSELEQPAKTVKLQADLHRKARTVASYLGLELVDYLDQLLRPLVERAYANMGREIKAEGDD